MAPKKGAVTVEVALVPLKNCLVNLPPTLVNLLVNSNTAAQNVIVEFQYRHTSPSSAAGASSGGQRSAFAGWSGMPSKRRGPGGSTSREPMRGLRGGRGGIGAGAANDEETPIVEIDATFGNMVGLQDSQKASLLLHVDPPVASTVNIEPCTPADWEIIELHATFLELNLLSQIRALPNPGYSPPSGTQTNHPLILHLSPTSTANITVVGLTPAPSPKIAFAKISPEAEVIVAPKVRQKSSSISKTTASANGTATSASTTNRKGSNGKRRPDFPSKPPVFLRGIDRKHACEWFDPELEDESNDGLRLWLDTETLARPELQDATHAAVSLVRPASIYPLYDQQQIQQQKERESADAGKLSKKVVAKIYPWHDGPGPEHASASSSLCAALECEDLVGGILRVEAAPPQLPRSSVKGLKIYPFASTNGPGKPKPSKDAGTKAASGSNSSDGGNANPSVERIRLLYGTPGSDLGFFSGPLTDGMLLPKIEDPSKPIQFAGGLIRFDPPLSKNPDAPDPSFGWLAGSETKLRLELAPEIIRPRDVQAVKPEGEPVPEKRPRMVAIDKVIANCLSNLTRSSSILVTGGLGSGKTELCRLLGHTLCHEQLFSVSYFSCAKLVTDETRVSTIKETLARLFQGASWFARLRGRAVVILDDLDKLCPVETELQVGGENGRSRQVSEIVCSIVHQYCGAGSPVVLLATAQAKESLNNVIVGGHVVREIIALKAPDKEGRRKLLEMLITNASSEDQDQQRRSLTAGETSLHPRDAWADPRDDHNPEAISAGEGFVLNRELDFLDLAGKTDGYMPGDLVLLTARARNEALIRSVQESASDIASLITLGSADFESALHGFTPASLRNVTLTSSSTTFAGIGGLKETRQTLLETLEYPTRYAPIFAQCPLRLRSGLLLYGFPGCGKTMLASAVAGECGLNFISVKGPEILNKYIGASEKSVRDLFERAEAAKPCVLFFDEFDSIAPKRGHDSTGVTDRVVNQLLTQMDGAEGLSGVYVLAATSRPDLIDPALLRPGRLDKSLLCDLPNHEDRVDIVRAVSVKLNLSKEVKDRLDEIAARTDGYSGADLQAIVYNAHLEAIHDSLGDRVTGSGGTSKQGKTGNPAVTGDGHDDSPFPFKFRTPSGGRVHRIQLRPSAGIAELVAAVSAKLAPADLAAVGGEAVLMEGVLVGGFALSYLDNEGDSVAITADNDLVDAVVLARQRGAEKVDLFVHDPEQPPSLDQAGQQSTVAPSSAAAAAAAASSTTMVNSAVDGAGKEKGPGDDAALVPSVSASAADGGEKQLQERSLREKLIPSRPAEEQLISGVPNELILPGAMVTLAAVIAGVFVMSRVTRQQ
ncbi:Peroxisome biosynthesis protein pex1 [Ascosphaera acerosa]|nr:Peroxisome biosynthesis protein pex1 [Ascosphaera acerosa]